MSNATDNPKIEVLKAGGSGVFTNYIYKAIPLAFDESMSYYETLAGLRDYLEETVIPTVNNNAEAVAELQSLYEELNKYVDDYFKNLDVQEEINNKLDDLVEDGTLTRLIGAYVQPLIDEQNQEIAEFKTSVNSQIAQQNAQIQAVASGSPLVASSVSGMTDTTKVYVNTTDGKWYYYNGTQWVAGGVYQASEDSSTVSELERLQGNIVENIENYVENNKFIEWEIGNIDGSGNLISANDRIRTKSIFHNIYPIRVGVSDGQKFRFKVIYYDENGTYLSQIDWNYGTILGYVIPANSYFRLLSVRYSSFEDLRPIGVYNSDVYLAMRVKNIYNLSLLVDLKDEIDALSSKKFKILNPILKNYLNYTTSVQIQGLTKVEDDFWQFSASSSDHSSWYGQILQIDRNKNVTIKYHDFGHIPSVNYIKNKDMLVFSNAGDTGITPMLQFYKNVSQHNESIFSVDDENYLEIDLSSIGGVTSAIGESDNIVYLYSYASKNLIKCLIGYGTNDYSSDLGTYNYVDDNTINGTLKILSTYNLTDKISNITDTIQSIYYLKDGRFAFLVGTSTSYLYIYSFNNENDFVLDEVLNLKDMQDNGTYLSAEPQSIYQDFETDLMYISYKIPNSLKINIINK